MINGFRCVTRRLGVFAVSVFPAFHREDADTRRHAETDSFIWVIIDGRKMRLREAVKSAARAVQSDI